MFQDALRDGVSNLSFGALSGNLGRTMYQYKFRIPPYYTLLVRSLSVLEGIALASDPNYKVSVSQRVSATANSGFAYLGSFSSKVCLGITQWCG